MVDGAELPDYTAGAYTVTVTIGMPDGTDQAATTQITEDSTDRFIGQVTATALHLRRQRHAMQGRIGPPILDPDDVQVERYFADGQRDNEDERGVSMRHVPTGITVRCDSERSRLQNTAATLRELTAKVSASGSGTEAQP